MTLFGSKNRQLFCLLHQGAELKLLNGDFPSTLSFPSLSPQFPSFQILERELYEEQGLVPIGHPWLKPVRHPRGDIYEGYEFFASQSSALHEVGVGPVHAGVIEPGHFRFTCRGEIVEYLEIQLGYQHRGIIRIFEQDDIRDKVSLAECIAGDTAIGHALAYCGIVEALTATPPLGVRIRIIALELERIAMHLAVLSALAGDVAYLLGQNLLAALRTEVINTTLSICGSRFGKRWLCPGGVNYGIPMALAQGIVSNLKKTQNRIRLSCEAMLSEPSVLSRFDDTGKVTAPIASEYGFTGIVAKAAGLKLDSRVDFPLYPQIDFIPCTECSGDVYARAQLRYLEIMQSFDILFMLLKEPLDTKPLSQKPKEIKPDSLAISIVEGYRGRILHLAKTAGDGSTEFYRIVDPSLVNWQALAIAVRGEGISDFPLCNKSFDLSYCGSDL
ncbi:MAG: hypothetical protein PHI68_00235 [Candidatus Cloacimonetes bacterium]|nr:hypothetical protein [Candidatus Cloacimonadota bacterium]